MSDLKMVVTEESWNKMPDNERSWLLYQTVRSLDRRVEKIENRKWLDSAKILFGSMIGGAAAAIGINIGGIGK